MAYTAIDDSGGFYSTTLYVGNAPSSNSITGVGFQPDTVWLKERDGSDNHQLINAVIGAGYYSSPDENVILQTLAESLQSFDSDGFTVGNAVQINQSGQLYLSWNWKQGTTTGIDTTGSSITPTAYSFNQTAGQSVIKYTGDGATSALIPHGLGAVPAMIVVKGLTTNQDWAIYHHKMDLTAPEDYYIKYNTSGGRAAATDRWNDTAPTSVLFTVGSDIGVNDAYDYIAYCYTPIQGYSKFGTYEGNGNADGQFVYCGFRPAFVMCKDIDSSNSWNVFDNKRLGYNVDNNSMIVNSPNAELTTDLIDLLSNGFKFRSSANPNTSSTYIFAAFAESSLVNSNGVPNNAR